MYTEIDRCRVCGNRNLVPIVHLGNQYLTGVFPSARAHLQSLTNGPLELVKCHDDQSTSVCGLLQLRQSYPLSEMYGDNYGYRSSLNRVMVGHLQTKVRRLTNLISLSDGDYVIDIGSNDATLLRAYPETGLNLIGIDPTANKFRQYYPDHIRLIPEFFSAKAFREEVGDHKAKIITSIAMFYDLEDPMHFMRQVHDILADDGVWVFEQSYMPRMLENISYDTICHEHLEYYGVSQIKWMADQIGFRFLDIEMNDINGGSFSVTLTKSTAAYPAAVDVEAFVARETRSEMGRLEPYFAFAESVEHSRHALHTFLTETRVANKRIYGLGASTKGNVILQYCGVTESELPLIGEVNSDKFGSFTPGTCIPIVPEQEVLAMKPDYLLVLPWHFRSFFEYNPNYKTTTLVFPLPVLAVSQT